MGKQLALDFSTTSPALPTGAKRDGLLLKTSPVSLAANKGETLRLWLERWLGAESIRQRSGGRIPVSALDPKDSLNGPYWMRNGSDWRSGASVCSLSAILVTGPIDPRYFLSPLACQGILRRAEKRGKALPEQLRVALQAVVDSERISTSPADCSQSPSASMVGGQGRIDAESETFIPMVTHALKGEGHDASEDGTGRGVPLVPVVYPCLRGGNQYNNSDAGMEAQMVIPVAFSCKDHGADAGELSPTLRAMGHDGSHANAGGQVAIAIQERAVSENLENGPQGKGYQPNLAYTLEVRNKVQSVATHWAVRRLLPVECERLQGFPDGWTAVTHRKKPAADGPRYKAIGNSKAVPVVRWIGRRIMTAME